MQNPVIPNSQDRCPACGATVQGGLAGCQVLFDELTARTYTDLQLAGLHSLAFDAYCMQHPERYCVSAKSYAAHLARLCCGLEYGGSQQVYRAIQQWLSGSVALDRPQPPDQRGKLTVADVLAAHSLEEHTCRVQAWALDVWGAYAHQHKLGRAWVNAALGEK